MPDRAVLDHKEGPDVTFNPDQSKELVNERQKAAKAIERLLKLAGEDAALLAALDDDSDASFATADGCITAIRDRVKQLGMVLSALDRVQRDLARSLLALEEKQP